MPEYVTKEAVKQAMRSQPRGILFTEWELDQIPTVDVMEVVHGYWRKEVRRVRSGIWGLTAYCSVCDRLYPKVDHTGNIERFDFPPGLDNESFAVKTVLRWTENRKLVPCCCYCGARMDGGINK